MAAIFLPAENAFAFIATGSDVMPCPGGAPCSRRKTWPGEFSQVNSRIPRCDPAEPHGSSSSKPTSPRRWPKPSNCCPANFPPQARTLDKGHGRIELRELWCAPTNPAAMGLAGVGQVVRIHRHTQHLRKGQVFKETDEVVLAATTLVPEQTRPDQLLQLARAHWSIENGQHHRRDRTQREDNCTVRDTNTARNLSLLRSLAIFLFQQQRKTRGGKESLPDYESRNHSHPWNLINRFMKPPL